MANILLALIACVMVVHSEYFVNGSDIVINLPDTFHLNYPLEERDDNGQPCYINNDDCKSRHCSISKGVCLPCKDSSPCRENERCSVEGWCKVFEDEEELIEEEKEEEDEKTEDVDKRDIEEDEKTNTKPPTEEEFNKTRISDQDSMVDEETGGKINYTKEDIEQGKNETGKQNITDDRPQEEDHKKPDDKQDKKPEDQPKKPDNQTKLPNDHSKRPNNHSKKPVPEIKPIPIIIPKKAGNIEDRNRTVEEYFYESVKGNKYTQNSQLVHLAPKLGSWMLTDLKTTLFSGILAGDIPFYEDIYRANVHEFKIQASVNLTTTFSVQLLNITRFEFSVDLIPALITASASAYTSTLIQDNCGWLIYGWQLLGMRTTMSMMFAKCGFNFRTLMDDSETWSSLFLRSIHDPLWLLNHNQCALDEDFGKYTYQLDSLSTESLVESWPILKQLMGQWNKTPEFYTSNCLGSLDLAWFLVPDPKKYQRQSSAEKLERQMKHLIYSKDEN